MEDQIHHLESNVGDSESSSAVNNLLLASSELSLTRFLQEYPSILDNNSIEIGDFNSDDSDGDDDESSNKENSNEVIIIDQNTVAPKNKIVRNASAVKGMQASMSKHHSGPVVIKKIINPHKNAKAKFGRVKTIFKKVFIIHY
jgi:hypothetical protein